MASTARDTQGTALQRIPACSPALVHDVVADLSDWQAHENAGFITEWDSLSRAASEPNPFFESWYLLASLRALDTRKRISLLTVRQNGKLIGLMPIERQLDYYRYPFPNLASWTHPNCFLGAPLVLAGSEAKFWAQMLEWADESPGGGLFLHLRHLPLESALTDALRQVVEEQDRPAALVHREERAMLASRLSAEDYFAQSLSGKKRKELRRQHKRLCELGEVVMSLARDSEGIEQWIDEFLALERSGWKGEAGSALGTERATAQLFSEALNAAAGRGQLERRAITLDGQPIAMLANLTSGSASFSYKTAFDERYARFSPGVLLQCENLQILDQPGSIWADSCASADHPMIDRIWRERRAIGRVSIAIGGKLRRAIFSQIAKRETGHAARGIGQ